MKLVQPEKVFGIKPEDTPEDARKLMLEKNIRHLPVCKNADASDPSNLVGKFMKSHYVLLKQSSVKQNSFP